MTEFLIVNPWVVAVGEIALAAVAGILIISTNVCIRKVRLGRYDCELKRDMLQRGFSAEDIRTVIEAGRRTSRMRESCLTRPTPESADHRETCSVG
jgi:hypothetical protein